MRSVLRTVLFALTGCCVSTAAQALPLLQLDIVGGHYNHTKNVIVAGSNPFTLVAVFTPPDGTTQAQLDRAFSEKVYMSAAVSPGISTPANLGSFTFDNKQVNVTQDMVYGNPPIEQGGYNQGYDPGDLPPHDPYPTYFTEFSFNFSPAYRTNPYNTAEDTGGLTPNANGAAYYRTFTVDTRNLQPGYVVHFDMYNDRFMRCDSSGLPCFDTDVQAYAPFRKTAESAPVPEPASLLLLGSGVVAGVIRRRRQKGAAMMVA